MPTQTEREYYRAGFRDGIRMSEGDKALGMPWSPSDDPKPIRQRSLSTIGTVGSAAHGRDLQKWMLGDKAPKRKRKLSAWNKFVKANSKKPRFRYRNGKLNLKKMAVAFRKTPAGKKKRR